MKKTLLITTISFVAIILGVSFAPMTPLVHADGNCPRKNIPLQLVSVEDLEGTDRIIAENMDRAGNQDGMVCTPQPTVCENSCNGPRLIIENRY